MTFTEPETGELFAILAAVPAALIIASGVTVSEYANPVWSPFNTLMPTPNPTLEYALLTFPSSRVLLLLSVCSKKRSA